ncbi:MAG: response regulator transcription factor [Lachnospiraceae bacterium]|nr:response regulator transcription factor [Lachnospiraceae bacterium]
MSIRVMLVDDHKMLREGIKQLIEFEPDITIVAQASDGEECLENVKNADIDVCVLDINLPDIQGTKLLKEIHKLNKKVKVLMLTVHNEVEYLLDALDYGANGYILKDSGSGELIKAIRAVFNGERYIQPNLIPMLNARLLKREDDNDKVKEITRREKQILVNIALGRSNKDIAEEFDISERTVKNHITSLFKKIDVSDRTQAAVFAIRNNLVDL